MKKTIITFTLLLSCIFRCYAQIEPEFDNTKFYLNLLTPGISIEKLISGKTTIEVSGDLVPINFVYESNTGFSRYYFAISPRLKSDLRFYYNRRKQKKELMKNSGNFVALTGGYFLNSVYNNLPSLYSSKAPTPFDGSFYVSPLWGIQRNYKSGFHFLLTFGYGISGGNNKEMEGIFVSDLILGFTIK